MSPSVLHLGGQTRIDAPTVLGLGLALVVVGAAVLVFSERLGPELAWLLIIVWFVCLGGVWSAGAWSSVTLDAAARQVVSRIGFLGWSAPASTRTFADYRAVVVTLKRSSENVGQTTTGSGFHKTSSRTKTSYSYALILHGLLGDLDLPLVGDGSTPEEAEALALEVARLGDWPTLRRGYVREPLSGAPRSRDVAFDAESPLQAP